MKEITSSPAYALAAEAHAGILYGDAPYVDAHLCKVAEILISFEFNTREWIEAGLLHDAIEDTYVTYDMIGDQFGRDVADLVWAVSGMGENRKARVADMHAKVRAYPPAAILKTADRIHNMESAKALPDQGLFKMYMREMDAFVELVQGLVPQKMLDRLLSIPHA